MNPAPSRPIIGITLGDPLGIGPEILIKALNTPDLYKICKPLVIGDKTIIDQAIALTGCSFKINQILTPDKGEYLPGVMDMISISQLDMDCSALGAPTLETGKAMETFITCGIDLALSRQIHGLVTCPITKTAMKLAGSKFHGHTELLAHRTRADHFAMMMAGDRLKVVLVTIHIPLCQVPGQLNHDTIVQTISLTHDGLKERFNIKNPRIGVAGLNPHAGEDRLFGNEEQDIIIPAIQTAQKSGMDVAGPLPPDTIFYQAVNKKFDAVVCMYHDQGLIPFKLVHFKDGVNTTLGLPIIRTSVDHGTAYDIAWKGIADPTSLVQAVKMAAFQAKNTQD